jgi:cytochrome c peroxidase
MQPLRSTAAVGVAAALSAFAIPLLSQDLDSQLVEALTNSGFTGTVGSSIEARLGRRIDPKLANLGRLLFFDTIHSIHSDNSCAGCHSPTAGFGDTQSLASIR